MHQKKDNQPQDRLRRRSWKQIGLFCDIIGFSMFPLALLYYANYNAVERGVVIAVWLISISAYWYGKKMLSS